MFRRDRLRPALVSQYHAIHALILRNLMLRYGRHNIGFLWAILEPMLLTLGVMVIWSVSGGGKGNVKVVELVFTGYMPLTLWRHLTNAGISIFSSNSPLLYHRQISLVDVVFARMGLEFIGTTAALLVVWLSLNAAGFVGDIQQYDLFILGWLMMGLISLACGILIAAATELSETAERFVQPIQYLNIPVSGAFFLVDWLPSWGQKIVSYHPLVHCYEVFRAGFFGDAITAHYDLSYYAACTFVLSYAAIVSIRAIRSRVRLN